MKAWKTVAGALVLALMAVLALGWSGRLPHSLDPFADPNETSNTQVVHAVQRQEKVVLLSLGVQGLAEENTRRTILGKDVPGTGRTIFLQYTYQAMLGIDGSDVTVEATGENSYRVMIPEFIFIGSSEHTFKTAIEDNGILSWVTPEIDTTAMIARILDDQAKDKHINDNVSLLQEQAQSFYGGIIRAVSPEATVEFRFVTAR